ncbi:MAG TPA: hypothetical protein PLA83_12170 [Deltaproteobacteria bacterium]|jgi:hypothetical protein|nr:hypothetical protein [Deltaproteobacteria bacterium]HQI01321.1 hypothetical protein [Deltaproteobacteria bacterium]
MASIELSKEELSLIRMLLMKEEVSTRIERHHARGVFEYRDYLKGREEEIDKLLGKVKGIMGEKE